jgi:hypothetical protein
VSHDQAQLCIAPDRLTSIGYTLSLAASWPSTYDRLLNTGALDATVELRSGAWPRLGDLHAQAPHRRSCSVTRGLTRTYRSMPRGAAGCSLPSHLAVQNKRQRPSHYADQSGSGLAFSLALNAAIHPSCSLARLATSCCVSAEVIASG